MGGRTAESRRPGALGPLLVRAGSPTAALTAAAGGATDPVLLRPGSALKGALAETPTGRGSSPALPSPSTVPRPHSCSSSPAGECGSGSGPRSRERNVARRSAVRRRVSSIEPPAVAPNSLSASATPGLRAAELSPSLPPPPDGTWIDTRGLLCCTEESLGRGGPAAPAVGEVAERDVAVRGNGALKRGEGCESSERLDASVPESVGSPSQEESMDETDRAPDTAGKSTDPLRCGVPGTRGDDAAPSPALLPVAFSVDSRACGCPAAAGVVTSDDKAGRGAQPGVEPSAPASSSPPPPSSSSPSVTRAMMLRSLCGADRDFPESGERPSPSSSGPPARFAAPAARPVTAAKARTAGSRRRTKLAGIPGARGLADDTAFGTGGGAGASVLRRLSRGGGGGGGAAPSEEAPALGACLGSATGWEPSAGTDVVLALRCLLLMLLLADGRGGVGCLPTPLFPCKGDREDPPLEHTSEVALQPVGNRTGRNWCRWCVLVSQQSVVIGENVFRTPERAGPPMASSELGTPCFRTALAAWEGRNERANDGAKSSWGERSGLEANQLLLQWSGFTPGTPSSGDAHPLQFGVLWVLFERSRGRLHHHRRPLGQSCACGGGDRRGRLFRVIQPPWRAEELREESCSSNLRAWHGREMLAC